MLATIKNIALIFWLPTKIFQHKGKEINVVWAFAILVVLNVLAEYLLIPFKVEIMKQLVRVDMGESHLEAWTTQFTSSMQLGLAFVPLIELIKLLIASIFLWALGVMLNPIEFSQVFKLLLMASFIIVVGELLGVGVLYMKPLEAIPTPLDLINQFGLHVFFPPDTISKSIEFLFSEINVFSISWFCLMVIFVRTVTNKTLKICINTVLPLWLLSIFTRLALFNLGKSDVPIDPFL